MEVLLDVNTRVGEEADERSLLDEVVLVVDANVLHLLLGGYEPLLLALLNNISPLGDELLGLVTRVDVVEVRELGSNQEGEVAHLRDTQIEGDDVLVVEDHATEPFVMGPAAHAREGCDRSNVEEEEDKTTTGSAQGLVVRGDLLGTDSLEQSFHVIVVREGDRVLGGVVGVLVTFLHVHELIGVVALAVEGLVLWLLFHGGFAGKRCGSFDVGLFKAGLDGGGCGELSHRSHVGLHQTSQQGTVLHHHLEIFINNLLLYNYSLFF